MPRLFALSDPHLSHARPKPMDIFGDRWDRHAERIAENWRGAVADNDIVLVPGDISWAMRLHEALPDLEWLAALPGRKVLLRGNHDYWWASLKKMRDLNLPNLFFIHNNHVTLDGIAVGGSRLWDFPFVKWNSGLVANADEPAGPRRDREEKPEDLEKVRAHEMERLAHSLGGLPEDAVLRVAMTHFPPLGEDGRPTPLTDAIGAFGVDICVFGHIHTHPDRARPGEDIVVGKTRYVLAASDHLLHAPVLLAEAGGNA